MSNILEALREHRTHCARLRYLAETAPTQAEQATLYAMLDDAEAARARALDAVPPEAREHAGGGPIITAAQKGLFA